jgi:uncharacterized protein YdhG (YjbR/CyaY superfamily)
MPPPKARPTTVAEYIADAPRTTRAKLRELRTLIRRAAPGAIENLKWGMPAYSHRRILVMFAGFKNHVSLFATLPTLRAFKQELAKFKTARVTIQFPLDQPLPRTLIHKITAHRVKESLLKDKKWKS